MVPIFRNKTSNKQLCYKLIFKSFNMENIKLDNKLLEYKYSFDKLTFSNKNIHVSSIINKSPLKKYYKEKLKNRNVLKMEKNTSCKS